MEITSVQLTSTKRRFNLPFPLQSLGFIDSHPATADTVVYGKLELCIRLSSNSEFSYDRFNNLEYICRYPNVCIKNPDMIHHIRVEAPRDAFYFKYDPALGDAVKQAGLSGEPYCWHFTMTPEINLILREVRKLLPHSQEPGVADQLDMYALSLWQKLILMREEQDFRPDYNEAIIRRIASFIQLNFMNEFDLDELLVRHGLSRRNFFRHWQKSFLASPAAYLRQLRLNESCRLLEETNLSVEAIAECLHLSSASYFCLVFKQRFDLTPHQYRKMKRLE